MSVLKGEGKYPILFGSTTIAADTRLHQGYLARPDLAGEWPTVVVSPDVWGVSPSVKDLCRRLARRGLAAVSVDPYRGAHPARDASREEAAAMLAEVGDASLEADLNDLVSYVVNPAGFWSSAGRGFGVLGLGAGGRIAVRVAARRRAAGIALVSTPFHELTGDLSPLPTPVLGVFGRADEVVAIELVLAARSTTPHAEFVIYEGVREDFYDDNREGYDAEAAADATERITAFFEKHLPSLPE